MSEYYKRPIKRVACQHVKDGATVDMRIVDESVAIDLCHECAQRRLSLRLTAEGGIVFIDEKEALRA